MDERNNLQLIEAEASVTSLKKQVETMRKKIAVKKRPPKKS